MSRDQGPTDCCTGQCNQGRACIMRTENGGMTDGLHVTMYEPANQPWDWIDQVIGGIAWCVLFLAVAAIFGFFAGFASAFFK